MWLSWMVYERLIDDALVKRKKKTVADKGGAS